ncbi:hypothetical protein GGF44_002962 [Coemansia sp. RSA 1694]|nr:hypothetical protein GGF44_002962 [Coemansia sp. RSA 1694]
MISTATVHSFAERKTKNLFGMRPAWLKKDSAADSAAAAAAAAAVGAAHAPSSSLLASPDSPRIKELAGAAPGKPKALSRTRVRELLTIDMIRTYTPANPFTMPPYAHCRTLKMRGLPAAGYH